MCQATSKALLTYFRAYLLRHGMERTNEEHAMDFQEIWREAEIWMRGGDGKLRLWPTLEERAACTTEYLAEEPFNLNGEWSDEWSSWC